ncbi:MAG: cyclic nucleotide-binding domain-containing protein [Sphingomonas sp.]|nr:cyclic nucleotide-binding domain-containing protein [Sphingomonas sp.]
MPPVEALLLHLGYALLVAAVLVARPTNLRVLAALAAAAWLARALVWTQDSAGAVWAGILLVLCLYLLARNLLTSRRIRFTAEERALLDGLVAGISNGSARHLMDQGVWLSGKEGDVLTREGEPVAQLYYLAEGEARVMNGDRQVGRCGPGDLIGELTVLSGEKASATVILAGPARFWCAAADDLRPYVEANEDIRRAIEHGFATALKAKLRASNRALAEAGGVVVGYEHVEERD